MLPESNALDSLPFGVLSLRGEDITYANRLLRSFFDGGLSTLDALIKRYPELEELRKDTSAKKSPVWLNVNATVFCVVRTPRGEEVDHYFLPGWFVSDTAPALEALQANYDDFVEIFENCFDGIYVADGEGRTLWMNAGFERCYGLSARNFLGRDASTLEREGYLDPLITWKIITTKKRQTALQTTKSGRKVLATGIPLLAPDGTVRRVIINSHDTTELIEMQSKLTAAEREIQNYQSELQEIRENTAKDGELFWASDEMQEIVRVAMRIARTDAPVIIRGPSGAGKRKLADLVFRYSKRSRKRVIRISFEGLPEPALLTELFGRKDHKSGQRGDGVLDRAGGGTLILERIEQMPPRVQERLSNWLREEDGRLRSGRAKLRLISTCSADLGALLAEGKFREDLFYRLNVAHIEIPPLKERLADIAGLAQHFLGVFCKKYETSKSLEKSAITRLTMWPWPGNVRELRTIVERLVVMQAGTRITAKDVDKVLSGAEPEAKGFDGNNGPLSSEEIRRLVNDFEATLIRQQVDHAGSIRKAATATGISVSTIKRKLSSMKEVRTG